MSGTRGGRGPVFDSESAPIELVTVAIPARDEEASLGACLESVLAQDEPNLQVIVIDGASNDGTADVARAFARRDARVELIHNPDAIISKSLNLALERARGTWFVRVDAHCTIPSTYVSALLCHLESGQWGGVGGRKDGVGQTPVGRAIATAMASRFGQGNSVYHYGEHKQTVDHVPFGAYSTALAVKLGGWDERLPVNQDYEFDYRVRRSGYDLLFDPSIRISWDCRQTVAELFRQYRRYGRDKARCVLVHPRATSLRHLAPPALLATLGSAALVAARSRGAALATVAPYAVALAGASALTARKVEPEARRHVPSAFAAMHVGWGLGFWEGMAGEVRNRARRRPVRKLSPRLPIPSPSASPAPAPLARSG